MTASNPPWTLMRTLDVARPVARGDDQPETNWRSEAMFEAERIGVVTPFSAVNFDQPPEVA